MNCSLYILPSIVMLILLGCTSRKPINYYDYSPIIIAVNDDTINCFEFVMMRNNHFSYSIRKDSSTDKQYYHGIVSLKQNTDTIYLNYYKNQKPVGLKNYLVREISGLYLIQFFDSSSKRVFLHRQSTGYRF